MLLTAYRLLLLLLFMPSLYTHAQNHKPQSHNEPTWITFNAAPTYNDKLDFEAEEGTIDLVYEMQISLKEQSIYIKRAIKLLSEAGVQNSSEISIDYDPAYQQLIFHQIKLIRSGRIINKLDLSKVKTVQQERELSDFIYNGSLSAVLFLEDVQKGDVLEYSYTLKGFNPVFGRRYSRILDLAFSVPVYQIYYKVLVPQGRSLSIKNSKTDIAPFVSTTTDGSAYEWRLTNVAALRTEKDLPSWYDPYPMVMISEFQTWKEVNDWALRLFPFDISLSNELKSKVQELKRTYPTPESQAQAALRFVQDDIRYMGIEMGENS
jgi:hypothetical protein